MFSDEAYDDYSIKNCCPKFDFCGVWLREFPRSLEEKRVEQLCIGASGCWINYCESDDTRDLGTIGSLSGLDAKR